MTGYIISCMAPDISHSDAPSSPDSMWACDPVARSVDGPGPKTGHGPSIAPARDNRARVMGRLNPFLPASARLSLLDIGLARQPAVWRDVTFAILTDRILLPTNGHLIFEDQLYAILTRAAQFTRSEAKLLILALGASQRGSGRDIRKLQTLFVFRLAARGVSPSIAAQFWLQEIVDCPRPLN